MTQEQFDALVEAKVMPYGEALDEVSADLEYLGVEHQEFYDDYSRRLAN